MFDKINALIKAIHEESGKIHHIYWSAICEKGISQDLRESFF